MAYALERRTNAKLATPVSSHRLADQTESPNVAGINACPTSPPGASGGKPSRRRGRDLAAAAGGPEGVERWAFVACLAVGSALWCALLRIFLRRHKFPYHRHRLEATALYAGPPLVFAGLLARDLRPAAPISRVSDADRAQVCLDALIHRKMARLDHVD